MLIEYTVTEGGYWHQLKVSRKVLNGILKEHCLSCGRTDVWSLAAVKIKIGTKFKLYDFKIYMPLKSYFRKELK